MVSAILFRVFKRNENKLVRIEFAYTLSYHFNTCVHSLLTYIKRAGMSVFKFLLEKDSAFKFRYLKLRMVFMFATNSFLWLILDTIL
jgi:hypothetical protein